MVVLQVLCHYEFMIGMGPLMSKNQVMKSLSYVASPHWTWLGEGAFQVLSIRGRVRLDIGDEGWAIHTDGSLRYRGCVAVP